MCNQDDIDEIDIAIKEAEEELLRTNKLYSHEEVFSALRKKFCEEIISKDSDTNAI